MAGALAWNVNSAELDKQSWPHKRTFLDARPAHAYRKYLARDGY